MCFMEKTSSSDLHLSQMSWIAGGMRSSQSTFDSHSCCRRIDDGRGKPPKNIKYLGNLGCICLVTSSRGGKSAIVKRKWSTLAFHTYSCESGVSCIHWESLSLAGMCCKTVGSLKFHLRRRKPPLEKRTCSCSWRSIASLGESAPVKPSPTWNGSLIASIAYG